MYCKKIGLIFWNVPLIGLYNLLGDLVWDKIFHVTFLSSFFKINSSWIIIAICYWLKYLNLMRMNTFIFFKWTDGKISSQFVQSWGWEWE